MTDLRIAMWSGPRNISTAMMRAWENRDDCDVWDEPLYGYYLHKTGIAHPGAEEIIADQGVNWLATVEQCSGESPQQNPLFYQKHMTLHLLSEIDRSFLQSLVNCFLIREPERVIASYAAVRGEATLEDIGFIQQAELFEYVHALTGEIPVVIDSREFLQNPEAMLCALCKKLGIAFDEKMLSWPPGPRDSDGVWAKYWYDSVWNSTNFTVYQEKPVKLSRRDHRVAEKARPYYDLLHGHRLRP